MAATRKAGCAASITGGRWTSRATSSRCRPSRRRPAPGEVQAPRLPVARSRRLRLGLDGRPRRHAGVPAAALRADAGRRASHRQGAWCPATGRRSWRGRSTARIPPRCIPPTWCLPAVGGAANAKNWTRPSTDRAPRLQVQLTSYGFRYAAIRRPIPMPRRMTTSASPPSWRPSPPDPAQRLLQRRRRYGADGRHACRFHFIAWGDGPDGLARRAGGSSSRCSPASTWMRGWAEKRVRGQRLPAGPHLMSTATSPASRASPRRTWRCGRAWARSPTAPPNGSAPPTSPSCSGAA